MKTEEKKDSRESIDVSPNSLAHGGPFLKGFIVNLVLGYVLYFIAGVLHEPPMRVSTFIEYLKPTIKALDTAAHLSENPFPAQVVILYAPVSAVLLAAYFIYCTFFVKKIRQELYKHLCERMQLLGVTPKQRLKLAGNGIFVLIISLSLFPMGLLIQDPDNISWRAAGFFSTSVFSVGFLLLTSGVVALGFILGLGGICASISNFQFNKQTRD